MNWKTLGKAALVTCGLCGIIALILVIGHFFPWICGILGFVSVLALVYITMNNDDGSDNDRMQWFSSDNEEEEEEDD